MKIIILVAIAVAAVGVVVWVLRGGRKDAAPSPRANRGPARPLPLGAGGAAAGVPTTTVEKANWLVAIEGPIKGKSFHVGQRVFTIGRGPGNHIQVVDNQTSRVHCQIVPKDGGLEFHDMDSQNGTFVNDERTPRGLLREGDRLRIGTVTLEYRQRHSAQRDDAMVLKMVGGRAADGTVAEEGMTLESLVAKALAECGGDRDAAALKLGMKRAVLDQLLANEGATGGPERPA